MSIPASLKTHLKRSILHRGGAIPLRKAQEPFVIAGMFRTANGLGEVARRFYGLARANGLTPISVDTSEILGQIDLESDIDLFEMPRSQSGTILLIANPPEIEALLRKLALWRWKSWRVISYWCWELEQIPETWPQAERYASEIWTLSDFAKHAIEPHVSKPIKTVPIPVPAPGLVPMETSRNQFSCLMMADGRSSFTRKNILAGIDIFKHAFAGAKIPSLTIKLRHSGAFPGFLAQLNEAARGHPNISILDETLSDDAKWNLINNHDVILSPHRAEGYGLHLAEAMVLEKCVVATGWSGNLQFMNSGNSVLLQYRKVPVEDAFGIYAQVPSAEWADVEIEASARMLRDLFKSPEKRLQLGAAARRDILRELSNEAIFLQIKDALPSNDL